MTNKKTVSLKKIEHLPTWTLLFAPISSESSFKQLPQLMRKQWRWNQNFVIWLQRVHYTYNKFEKVEVPCFLSLTFFVWHRWQVWSPFASSCFFTSLKSGSEDIEYDVFLLYNCITYIINKSLIIPSVPNTD